MCVCVCGGGGRVADYSAVFVVNTVLQPRKEAPQWMVQMATPHLLPFCQLLHFPINQPKVLVVRERYPVVTNVNLRVYRMAVMLERNTGNIDRRGSANSSRALS